MKKIFGITLCLLLISIALLIFFTSCSHEHVFGEWEPVLEATCAAEGKQERVCECGEKEVQPIEALPHTEGEWVNEVIATTMNKGIQSSYCTVCQEPLTRELPQRITKHVTYTVNADGVTCTVTGRKLYGDLQLGIPEEIDGYKVTAIGENAFYNIFPGFTHLYIPEGVTHIEAGAFLGTNYKNVYLPSSLVYIADAAIQYSTSGNYNKYDNALYLGNEDNPYMFLVKAEHINITSCNIHPDTKFIATHAFNECKKLTTITIPDSVIQIGSFAFSECTSLSAVKLPQGLTTLEIGTFSHCTNLKTVIMGDGLKTISPSAFMECESLEAVLLPEGLETIHVYAFLDCVNLKYIPLPANIKEVAEDAFKGCGLLKTS